MTATASRPREQMADRVTGCIEAGDLRQALEACQELNRHHPDYAYGWYLASWVLRKTRRLAGRVAGDRSRAATRSCRPVPVAPRTVPARGRGHGGGSRGCRRTAGPATGRRRAARRTRHAAVPGGQSCRRAGALLGGHRSRPRQRGVPFQPGRSASLPRRRRGRRAGLRRGHRVASRRARGLQRARAAAQANRHPQPRRRVARRDLPHSRARRARPAALRAREGARGPRGARRGFRQPAAGRRAQALADALRRRHRLRDHRPDSRGVCGRALRRPVRRVATAPRRSS